GATARRCDCFAYMGRSSVRVGREAPGRKVDRRGARSRRGLRRAAYIGARCARAAASSRDLAQAAALDLVDEAAHAIPMRDEGARLDAGDRLAHVGVEVGERLGRPWRPNPALALDPLAQLV